jgi:hypothetical protein
MTTKQKAVPVVNYDFVTKWEEAVVAHFEVQSPHQIRAVEKKLKNFGQSSVSPSSHTQNLPNVKPEFQILNGKVR